MPPSGWSPREPFSAAICCRSRSPAAYAAYASSIAAASVSGSAYSTSMARPRQTPTLNSAAVLVAGVASRRSELPCGSVLCCSVLCGPATTPALRIRCRRANSCEMRERKSCEAEVGLARTAVLMGPTCPRTHYPIRCAHPPFSDTATSTTCVGFTDSCPATGSPAASIPATHRRSPPSPPPGRSGI